MTTIHCLDRANERYGFKDDYTVRFVNRALARGRDASSYKNNKCKRYLSKGRDGRKLITFAGKCLVVNDTGVCFTIYDLPEWFGDEVRNRKTVSTYDVKQYRKHGGMVMDELMFEDGAYEIGEDGLPDDSYGYAYSYDKEYGSANPWDAPGMSVSDFIGGVVYD